MDRTVLHYHKTPILDQSISENHPTEDDRIVCLSSWDVAVISMAIFPFFTWQARQAYPFVDNTYRLVSDSQFRANIDLLDSLSLKLEGVSMCDLNVGLQAIADAMVTAAQTRKADNVTLSQNCGGSCGCGGSGGGGNPFGLGFTGNIGPFQGSGSGGYTVNGGPLPPLSVGYGGLGEGDPPEGFATWDEYRVYKCQCAFAVYTTIHATFSALCSQAAIASLGLIVQTGLELGAVVNWVVTAIRFGSFGFSGGQITAVIFSTNGPVFAASIILGAAVALIAEAAILEQVGAEIEANKDDIICALYNSGSAGQAVSDVTNILQDLLLGLAMPETVAGVLVNVFESIFSPNVLDGLFRVAFDFVWPDADCSNCDSSQSILNIWSDIVGCGGQGTILSSEGDVHIVEAKACSGQYMVDFFISTVLGDLGTQINTNVDISITSGSISGGSPTNYRFWNSLGSELYNGNTPPSYPVCCSNGSLRSASPFTVELTLSECV